MEARPAGVEPAVGIPPGELAEHRGQEHRAEGDHAEDEQRPRARAGQHGRNGEDPGPDDAPDDQAGRRRQAERAGLLQIFR